MNRRSSVFLSMALMGAITLAISTPATAEWYPLEVDVWDPPFNAERERSRQVYAPLTRASTRWNICVSIPHLKDAYWLAVNFGLADEAKRAGVNLAIYEAGGYDRLEVQRAQIRECLDEGFKGEEVHGLILSAVDGTALNDMVKEISNQGIPVVDLVNGIQSSDIAARAAVTYYDLGYLTGNYLRELEDPADGNLKVAWFPGPSGPVWSTEGNNGFVDALAGSHIEIVATRYGDTGKATQSKLIEALLDELGEDAGKELDYIAGTAVTAEAAVSLLRRRGLDQDIKVLAYYYGPGVHQGIRRGTIMAAATDAPVLQARMAVDVMTRILEKQPYLAHVAPLCEMVDPDRLREWDTSTTLPPRGFRAMFNVEE